MGNGEAGAGATQREERGVSWSAQGTCVNDSGMRINPHIVLATLIVSPYPRSPLPVSVHWAAPYFQKQHHPGIGLGMATDWLRRATDLNQTIGRPAVDRPRASWERLHPIGEGLAAS